MRSANTTSVLCNTPSPPFYRKIQIGPSFSSPEALKELSDGSEQLQGQHRARHELRRQDGDQRDREEPQTVDALLLVKTDDCQAKRGVVVL